MLKIEINCQPEEMDEHLRQLGFMRRPFTGTETIPDSVRRALGDILQPKPLKRDEEQSGGGQPALHYPASDKITLADSGVRGSVSVTVDPKATSVNLVSGETTMPSLADEIDAQGLERPEDLKAPPQPEGSKRVPGQPAPGRKRRTKEELAEDLAYMAVHPEAGHVVTNTARAGDPNDTRTEAYAARTAELDAVIAAQDAADEAAETAARSTEPTREHLRAAIGRYTQKHGAKAAIDNTRALVGSKIEDVPADKIVEAIARVDAATAQDKPDAPANSVGMIDVADAPDLGAIAPATKAELVQAFLDYGAKFEGTSDPKKMTFSKEDGVKLLGQVFPGAKTIPDIPETPENFGKVVAAVRAAIESNPFKRTAH